MENFISQLLYRYQCVTVPGFGAFLTETMAASISESNHNFFPPKKVISFNPHIKNNDGLLANHIAQLENISYDEAVAFIEKEVSVWKEKLNKRDFLIFKSIGLLKLNGESNIVFESYNHTNYLTTSFGLASFVSPSIQREVLKAVVTDAEGIEVIDPTYVISAVDKKTNPFVSMVKYAAVLTMTIGSGAFGYGSYIQQQEKSETLIVQAQVQKEVQTKLQEATFFIANPMQEIAINPELNYNFYIVAGSFRNTKNANKSVAELQKRGYNAAVIHREEDLFSVVYGTYATQLEADTALQKIQSEENKDAWVLLVEKK